MKPFFFNKIISLGWKVKETPKVPASKRLVGLTEVGQRLDNYLFKHLKGVPKSYIYRIIRDGQVRINGGRVKPFSRLANGDTVRIPPLRQASESRFLNRRILVSPPRNLTIFTA